MKVKIVMIKSRKAKDNVAIFGVRCRRSLRSGEDDVDVVENGGI